MYKAALEATKKACDPNRGLFFVCAWRTKQIFHYLVTAFR